MKVMGSGRGLLPGVHEKVQGVYGRIVYYPSGMPSQEGRLFAITSGGKDGRNEALSLGCLEIDIKTASP